MCMDTVVSRTVNVGASWSGCAVRVAATGRAPTSAGSRSSAQARISRWSLPCSMPAPSAGYGADLGAFTRPAPLVPPLWLAGVDVGELVDGAVRVHTGQWDR